MRLLFASGLLFFACLVCAADYGEPLPTNVVPVSIAAALANADAEQESVGAYRGRVGRVCQNKGCWMMLTEGEAMVRVSTAHRFFSA